MKTYLINLAQATERLAWMQEALGQIGVSLERFDALDPARAEQHPVYRQIGQLRDRNWVPGEIACLLSHYEVWRLIAEGEDAYGMVLEDDLIVHPRLKKIIDEESGIPADADLVKLEGGNNVLPAWLSRRSTCVPGCPAYHRLLSYQMGTGAYLLSRQAARRLLGLTAKFNVPVDDLLFAPGHPVSSELRVYQAVPGVAVQNVWLPTDQRRPELGVGMETLRNREHARAAQASGLRKHRETLRQRLRRYYLSVFAIRVLVPFGPEP